MPASIHIGLAAAISAVLFATAMYVPAVAAPLLLIAPAPGLLIGVQRSSVGTILWALVSAAVLVTLLGLDATVAYVLAIAAPAFALASGVRAASSFNRVAVAGLAAWCGAMVCLLLLAYGSPERALAAAKEQMTGSFDLAVATSRSMGASEDALTSMAAEREGLIEAVVDLLPAFLILSGAVAVLANLLLVRAWTGIYGDVNLRLWRAPEPLIWVLIAAGFATFAPMTSVSLMARNLLVVLFGCYFCQGLAIVSYYFVRFRLPRAVRIASYALIAIHQVVAATVLALGVFDFWANFRRLSTGPADVSFRE
jgi:uncharacterized protein YybS (DUF2232 family)